MSKDAHMILRAVAQQIKLRRTELSISQEQLAERSGLHRTYISDVERGARNLSLLSLQRIAAVLDMCASALICQVEASALC